ncbi:ABC transporter permease [bacterium]|nr:ABC transporter permease [bacterium]
MDQLIQDIRYAIRMMFKNPGFTLVALITLALGIGANTAIFSLVNGLLLRPLPYGNPDRIVMVWQDYTHRNGREREWTSPDTFFDWRDQNHSFEAISVIDGWLPTILAGEPEQIPGATVTYNIFSVLGVSPAIGRTFVAGEDKPNGRKVVILSDGLWKRRFGGDRNVTGKDILINGEKYSVIGVMPPRFEFPMEQTAQIWTPMQVDSTNSCGRDCITLRSIARLKPSVSLAQAKSDMDLIVQRLRQQYPEQYRNIGIALTPLQEQLTEEIRQPLLVLLAAVGLVLLITCANVANLLLVRASGRKSEIAIRSALGAGKSRLTRQLITENMLLALIGGALGLFLGVIGIDLLVRLLPEDMPIIGIHNIGIDLRVLIFTLAISLATGLIFGLIPLFQFNDPKLGESLKEGGRNRVGTGSSKIRSLLVVSEVAFALMLLIGAGLLMKSFIQLINVNPGFQTQNVLTMQFNLPDSRYPEREQISAFYSRLLEKVKSLPGVIEAGTTSALPLGGSYTDTNFLIEGQSPENKKDQGVWFQLISKEYLQTMGIRLLKGRYFTDQDNFDTPRVVIVTESFARHYFPDGNVIGKRLNFNDPQKPLWREIVGVASDVKQFGLNKENPIAIYLHQKQSASPFVTLAIRTSGNPLNLASEIRSQVWSIDKNLAVSNVQTMEQVVGSTVNTPRITLSLILAFATAALLLAALGLYGVVSYSAAQRTNEIGIRMALGAERSDVLKMVVRQGMALTAIGVAIGLMGAFALTRLMSKLLFGVSATDPMTFVAISGLLILIALVASYIPAHRASKIDPVIALRYE